jgi:hypothetical protein
VETAATAGAEVVQRYPPIPNPPVAVALNRALSPTEIEALGGERKI